MPLSGATSTLRSTIAFGISTAQFIASTTAAKFDDRAVAGALDDAAVMGGDGRVEEITARPPDARQRAVLVSAGEPAAAGNIRDQDRREFPGLAHCSGIPALRRPSYARSFASTRGGSPPCAE
jgi:hypothetical protein